MLETKKKKKQTKLQAIKLELLGIILIGMSVSLCLILY